MQPEQTPIPPPKRVNRVLIVGVVVIVLIAIGLIAFNYLKPTATKSGNAGANTVESIANGASLHSTYAASSPLTAFEKKLNQSQLASLHKFSLPVFIPDGLPIENAVMATETKSGDHVEEFAFGSNLKYGVGNIPGAYSFTEYAVTSAFNPPTDCGDLLGTTSITDPCVLYAKSLKGLPAYVTHKNLVPGGITNTTNANPDYITMFAKLNNEVITIRTVSASPDALYQIILMMKQINPADLPEDTSVAFY